MKKILTSIMILFFLSFSTFAYMGDGIQKNTRYNENLNSQNIVMEQGMGQYQNIENKNRYKMSNIMSNDTIISHNQIITNYPKEDLSETEIESLIKMREEEKLARDVYLEMYDIYGVKIFSNIAQSESAHTLAIKSLLDKYNLDDPVQSDIRGDFTNPEFEKLYLDLVEKGKVDLSAALTLGATIEDLDINDLQSDLEKIDNQDITAIYNNLLSGSENHMRAYARMLDMTSNQDYTPTYISSEYYQEIISTDFKNKNDKFNSKNMQARSQISNENYAMPCENYNYDNLQNQQQNEGFFTRMLRGFGFN